MKMIKNISVIILTLGAMILSGVLPEIFLGYIDDKNDMPENYELEEIILDINRKLTFCEKMELAGSGKRYITDVKDSEDKIDQTAVDFCNEIKKYANFNSEIHIADTRRYLYVSEDNSYRAFFREVVVELENEAEFALIIDEDTNTIVEFSALLFHMNNDFVGEEMTGICSYIDIYFSTWIGIEANEIDCYTKNDTTFVSYEVDEISETGEINPHIIQLLYSPDMLYYGTNYKNHEISAVIDSP